MFRIPMILMMPMDGSAGGGGIKTSAIPRPPVDTESAFSNIEAGLRELTAGLRQAGASHSSVADGLMAVKGHVAAVEAALEKERERSGNLERILQDERRRTDALNGKISGFEIEAVRKDRHIHELTKKIEALEENARQLSESSRQAKLSFDEQASRMERVLANLDYAKAVAVEIFSNVDQTSNLLAGAYQAIQSLQDHIEPLFGAESPAVARVKEQAAAIGSAAASIDQLRGSKAELADLLRAEGSRTGLMDLRELRKTMPLLHESSFDSTKILSEQILLRLFARLATMFQRIDREETSRRLNAFLEAASTLLSRKDIPGSINTVYEAISFFVDLRAPDQDCRGLFYQMIRIADMLKSGRKLDNISAMFSELEFQGWQVSGREIRTRKMVSRFEVDAMEGNTLIEFKTVWFGDLFGAYLIKLLEHADKGPTMVVRDIDDVQNNVNHAEHAAKVANQLIRYKKIMDAGPTDSLELHITSYDPVPDHVLTALYDFFGRDRLKVFWYGDVLSDKPRLLAPKAEAQPAIAEPQPVPPPVEENGSPVREEPATGLAGADLIATRSVDLDPPSIILVGEDEAPSDSEVEATSSFYESRLAGLLGNDAERVERFVSWLVGNERWTPISELPKGDRRGPIEKAVHEWVRTYERSASSQANAPWAQTSATKAQNRFNSIFREITRKNVAIDWDQRVTQGVQNTDVMRVLSWIKDIDTIADDRSTGIVDMINDLIVHLRDTYRPEAYFKTDVDGRALTSIMQRFIWLIA